MPSRGNPNVPNKQRRCASRSKVQSRNAKAGIKKRIPAGASRRTGLFPTSGPLAPLSAKKARKVERQQNMARKRAIEEAMAQEGEVVMTDAPKTTKPKAKKEETAKDAMDVDNVA